MGTSFRALVTSLVFAASLPLASPAHAGLDPDRARSAFEVAPSIRIPAPAAPLADIPDDPEACPAEPSLEGPMVPLPELFLLALGALPPGASASFGSPQNGALTAGIALAASDDVAPAGAPWGTARVVQSIVRAAREVRRCYPETPRVVVGDLSLEHGGPLAPHRSHQSGLDADISYFFTSPAAQVDALDVPRTWRLVRALLEGGNVEMIFMDTRIQRRLVRHLAMKGPDDARWIDAFAVSQGPAPIIVPEPGHRDHFHVRFRDWGAQRRAYDLAWPRTAPMPSGAILKAP